MNRRGRSDLPFASPGVALEVVDWRGSRAEFWPSVPWSPKPSRSPRDRVSSRTDGLVKLDLHLRVHDPPDSEVRVELVTRRVDLDLTGTIHDRSLADAAKKRNEPIGELGIAKKKPQSEKPFARSSAFRRAPDSL